MTKIAFMYEELYPVLEPALAPLNDGFPEPDTHDVDQALLDLERAAPPRV